MSGHPFLRRCFRFPRSLRDREDDWCTPSRRRHRLWGTAYEVFGSIDAALATLDAPRKLFDFLHAEEENEDEGTQHGNRSSKIVWLSDDTFITANINWTSSSRLARRLDCARDKILEICLYNVWGSFWIVQQPSIPVAADGAPVSSGMIPPSSRCVDGRIDLVLRLLAHFSVISYLTIETRFKANDGDTELPASLDALKAFVGDPRMPPRDRTIRLQAAGLSQLQWDTVTANCKKNVKIEIDYNKISDESSFMETALLHHCPYELNIVGFQNAPADKRQLVLTALEATTCLERLNVRCKDLKKETFLLCMKAISRNRSIKKLHLYILHGPYDLTLEEWEVIFCNAIASHPTLKELHCFVDILTPSAEKDEILIKMVSQNTVLCNLEINSRFIANKLDFDSAVKPVLECNRLRQVVHAIKQEPNVEYRQQLFTKTLLSKRVCRHPAYRYLLLKENFDLWKDLLLSLECDSASSFGDLEQERMRPLENEMQDCGVVIPTSVREDEIDGMHRRKPKRSRSS